MDSNDTVRALKINRVGAIVERGAPDAVLGAPQRAETQRFLRRLLGAGRL